MNSEKHEKAFAVVKEILFNRIGESQAATIHELARASGIGRRPMEKLLEVKLGDFPFPVVATTSGYFRPSSAAEINHCLSSLQSRALCIFMRKRTIIRNALRAGYQRQGKRFLDYSAGDLFDYARRSA